MLSLFCNFSDIFSDISEHFLFKFSSFSFFSGSSFLFSFIFSLFLFFLSLLFALLLISIISNNLIIAFLKTLSLKCAYSETNSIKSSKSISYFVFSTFANAYFKTPSTKFCKIFSSLNNFCINCLKHSFKVTKNLNLFS